MAQHEASLADVLTAYREFLGREPESADAIVQHLRGDPSVWDLIRRLYHCSEAQRRRLGDMMGQVATLQDTSAVEIESSEEDADRLLAHVQSVWSKYGREEAYFSVLTDPRFLMDRLGVENLNEFYESGNYDAGEFLRCLQRNGIEPNADWALLELGCGVGRLGGVLAPRFAAYEGVDISGEHLAIAERRFGDVGIRNASLTLLNKALADSREFDVFFSLIVLQHNPPPIIKRLLDHFLGRVRPGGYAYFQVPCFIYDYSFSVSAYLAGEGMSEGMEMHPLPQREVFRLLERHGLTPVEVTPDARIGPIGFSYVFLARKS